MVQIKEVSAKEINDSRKQKTIEVSIKTSVGNFSASAPNGKSTGKYAAKIYKKSLDSDIKSLKKLSDYFSEEYMEKFEDLKRVEDIIEGHVGANTMFALESAILKAMAKKSKKQIWQIINPDAKKFPRLAGNCVGGGKHSETEKRPDFQEFLLIPKIASPKKALEQNKKAKQKAKELLKKQDEKFQSKKNDESAWMTSLNEKQVFDLLAKLKIPLGTDIASAGFYKRKKYHYQNPMLDRTPEEQLFYISNLIKNSNLFYIEDPFDESDFESHAKLLKKYPKSLIVGDDLIVTNHKRLKKAIELKAVNAIIVKPNQCGSLIEVKRVCELAKENKIKLIFSHRSGETDETILADIAFGFQADFFKCGIEGDIREKKILRLIEIEKNLKSKSF